MSIRDRFVFDARIGAGGMAEVFRARRVGVNDFARAVAIKRMLGGFATSTQFRELFIAEARLTSQLVHPNIVSVLDFDRDEDGTLCLVMELVDGCDLATLAGGGLLPLPVVNYIIVEALKGLGHAHGFRREEVKGIVHRDVSPHNLLLSWHGEVKVSDFGLAKTWTATAATATQGLKGKPAYMSPEQANSEPLDGRSDLFALGVIMWELLTGRRLFGADDTRASLAAVLFGTVPRPSETRPDVPRDLERVALKLLARDRNARYRHAAGAIADLLACNSARSDGQSMLARTMAERFGREMVTTPSQPKRTVVVTPVGIRRRWLFLIALGVPLAAVSVTALARRHKSAEQAIEPRVQDEHIALVEPRSQPKDTPRASDAGVVLETPALHFKYVLDPREVPRSCRQLFRFCGLVIESKLTTRDEKLWAVGLCERTHDTAAEFVSRRDDPNELEQLCRGSYGSDELVKRVAPDIDVSDLASLPRRSQTASRPGPWEQFYGRLQQLHRRTRALTDMELFGSASQALKTREHFPACFAELKLLDTRVLCASTTWQDRMLYERDIFTWRTRLASKDRLGTVQDDCRAAYVELSKKPAKGC